MIARQSVRMGMDDDGPEAQQQARGAPGQPLDAGDTPDLDATAGTPGGQTQSSFEWGGMDGFQGDRVAELKRKRATPPPPPQERLATAARNLAAQGPARVLLVACFVLLTFADLFFNMSRGVLCQLPDMCGPPSEGFS